MDASDVLLTQWHRQVKQIWPDLHQYQQNTLALAVFGIVLAGHSVIQRVAETLQNQLGQSNLTASYERQLQRFIDNERIDVQANWERFLAHTLPCWDGQKAVLVLDCTPYFTHFTIVFVGILVQKRLVPVAWEIMPQTEKWEEHQWPIVERLFEQVHASLHAKHITVLADRGLAALPLIRLCERFEWHYVLRIKKDERCRRRWRTFFRDWQRGGDFLLKKGQSWYGEVLLWQEHTFACTLSACWEEDFDEPWFLISDLPASHARISIYALRMRVEATFQDLKSRCWCLESSRLYVKKHLDRWLLAVFLSYWWTTHLGASCKRHGHAKLFDRADRFDKSVLRLGHLWVKELLKRASHGMWQNPSREAARLANCLPFHRSKEGLRFSIYLL